MVAAASIGAMQVDNGHKWFGQLLRFSDVRVSPREDVISYFKLTQRQVKTLDWLIKNHIPYYMQYVNSSIEETWLRSGVVLNRLGIVPEKQAIFVSLSMFRLDGLHVSLVEHRVIHLGEYGGRRLINHKERGSVQGDAVLKARV